MKSAIVKVWFEGDIGDASIEFTKTYKGDDIVAHQRFTKTAQKKFPSWKRITVERVEVTAGELLAQLLNSSRFA